MLTDADVKKLIQVFATRDEVVLKVDLDGFREKWMHQLAEKLGIKLEY